jgi:hypothetical protein
VAGRNWAKARARDLKSRARRDAWDDAAYLAELGRPRPTPAAARAAARGPATLRCTCGHSGRVDTSKHKRFRCSKCDKLWSL